MVEKMRLEKELEAKRHKEELEKEREKKLNEQRIKEEQNKRNRKTLIIVQQIHYLILNQLNKINFRSERIIKDTSSKRSKKRYNIKRMDNNGCQSVYG